MTAFLFLLFMTATPSNAESGVSVRGGGFTVTVGTQEVLLDFLEHGSEPQWFHHDRFSVHLTDTIAGVDQTLLEQKINDIATIDPVLAAATLQVAQGLSWNFSSRPLKPVDPDSSVQGPYHQAALRTGSQVLIDSSIWSAMTAEMRVALVIHEAVASLEAEPLTVPAAPRALVASLFDPVFALKPRREQLPAFEHFVSLETFWLRRQRLYNVNEIGAKFVGDKLEFAPSVTPHFDPAHPLKVCSMHVGKLDIESFGVSVRPMYIPVGGSNMPVYETEFYRVRGAQLNLANGCASPKTQAQLKELGLWLQSFKTI